MSTAASFIATYITRPENAETLRGVVGALGDAQVDWIADGVACDVALTAAPDALQMLREQARATVAGLPVDVVVQPAAGRRKHLFLADMDSTMIGQECIDELADMVGLKPRVAAITERAMRGEIAFEPALRERVALLAGLELSVVERVVHERIRATPGGATLVATLRANGVYTALVSGGFTIFTDRVATALGFDENRANVLDCAGGRLSGTVAEPILGQDAKLATLEELRQRFGLAATDTMAVGDGANDLPMVRGAGLGVAFRAKPRVAEAAAARIDHADLTALLHIQGYRAGEIVVRPDPAI